LSAICDRLVVFSGYSGFRYDITEIMLKVALHTINQTNQPKKKSCFNLKLPVFYLYEMIFINDCLLKKNFWF